LGSVFGALAIGIYTVVRDVVRDLSLARFGYDVYERVVYTNWWVVGAFLASLVGGLVFIGWLVLVVRSATPVEETHV
jgi:hypothetical protein